MNIQAETSEQNFDLLSILKKFEEKETTLTGSLIIHRGKVKFPGKKVPKLSHVLLENKGEGNLVHNLAYIGKLASRKFHIHQAYINHRLGKAKPGDDILLVIVSSGDRVNAFSAAQWIVDEIKKEKIISLTEISG